MYLEYFNLNELPFNLQVQRKAFIKTPQHSTLLNSLRLSLEQNDFLLKVTGQVGTGKTLIGSMLAKKMMKDDYVVFLNHQYYDTSALIFALAQGLNLGVAPSTQPGQIIFAIERFALRARNENKRVIFIFDEVQTFAESSLDFIVALTNLEENNRKLIQIILMGQHELDVKLSHYRWRQLRQRIAHHFTLEPLNTALTKQYILSRLSYAGWRGGRLFGDMPMNMIRVLSHGVPRSINNLCHKAMMFCCLNGKKNIGIYEVFQAYFCDRTSIAGRQSRLLWLICLPCIAGLMAYGNSTQIMEYFYGLL